MIRILISVFHFHKLTSSPASQFLEPLSRYTPAVFSLTKVLYAQLAYDNPIGNLYIRLVQFGKVPEDHPKCFLKQAYRHEKLRDTDSNE